MKEPRTQVESDSRMLNIRVQIPVYVMGSKQVLLTIEPTPQAQILSS